MAKDLYKSRQMYQGPWLFYIIIPIGAVFLMYCLDLVYRYYNEYVLSRDTKEVLNLLLESEVLETQEEYKEYARKKFEDMGYDAKDVTVILRDDYIILISYKSYFTVVGDLITKEQKIAVARYKGYLNEYKEAVIEEYTSEEDDEFYDALEEEDAKALEN